MASSEDLDEPRSLRGVDAAVDAVGVDWRTVILVEGASDAGALHTLAMRHGRHLRADGICVVAMHGATNIYRFLQRLGPPGLDLTLAGLCDAAEEIHVARGLERVGIGPRLGRSDLEKLGFFVCVDDLESELIRSLGLERVEEVIGAQGELPSLRILQQQPAQRGRSVEQQLHRFIGTRSGRKSRYARLLAEALDLSRVPRPLDRLLGHVYSSPTAPEWRHDSS